MNAWQTRDGFGSPQTRNREAIVRAKMLRRAGAKLGRRRGPRILLVEDDDGMVTSHLLERPAEQSK